MSATKLTKTGLYPIVDRQALVRLVGESVACMPSVGMYSSKYKACWTGEFRQPKEGEWYLSGSIIEAYYASRDMCAEYHIAEICEVEKVTEYRIKRVF